MLHKFKTNSRTGECKNRLPPVGAGCPPLARAGNAAGQTS
uniref:Uncharacterized protein n=1 Tax=Anguilla anguilla TaxID=7936 RepID=A0A0E9RWL0_ANGAN